MDISAILDYFLFIKVMYAMLRAPIPYIILDNVFAVFLSIMHL